MKKWLHFILVFALVPFAACSESGTGAYTEDQPAETGLRETPQQSEQAGNSLDRVLENPEMFMGQSLTVTGEIGEVYSPRAFTLSEPGMDLSRDILVLTRDEQGVAADQQVQVTGTLRRYSVVEIERELGWDLNPELETEIESRGTVIVANSVSPGMTGERTL